MIILVNFILQIKLLSYLYFWVNTIKPQWHLSQLYNYARFEATVYFHKSINSASCHMCFTDFIFYNCFCNFRQFINYSIYQPKQSLYVTFYEFMNLYFMNCSVFTIVVLFVLNSLQYIFKWQVPIVTTCPAIQLHISFQNNLGSNL